MYPFTGEAGAALAFLIGYLAVFVWMLFGFFTHRIKWRSRYSALLFHVTIRLASQGSGIGFGILGFRNTGLFVAFLVLGAEGYFSLVLCAFRFLISWHQHNLPSGESWLEPRDPPNTNKKRKVLIFAFLGPLAFLFYHDNPMVFFHSALILANVAIIVGGSYLAGADYSEPNSPDTLNRIRVSKITRTAGQSVFLVGNALLLIFILVSIRNNRRDGDSRNRKGTVHPTLILLLIAWFPLIVRGIFGLLQAFDWSMSYYNPENYDAGGFTPRFTAIEYMLGVFTEWTACVLLNCTYFTSKNDPKKRDVLAEKEGKRKLSDPSYTREMGRTAAQKAQLRALQEKNTERYEAEREMDEKENDDGEAAYPARKTTKHPSLRSQLDSVQEELVAAHDALSTAEALCQAHERVIAAHQRTISALRRHLEESQSKIDLLTSQLADSKVQVEELASELGRVYDGLKKESAKVTRLKRDREKSKGVAGSREATLVQELAEKDASIELQHLHTSALDSQLAQAKLIADEHRAKTKAIQAECEKYKKQAQRAKTSLEHTRKTLKALQNWDPVDAQNRNMYGSHTQRLMRQLDGVGVSSKHVGKVISIVANELGVRVKRVPSTRTVRMAVKEAGILSKVKLGREVALAKKIGASSNGTSIKRITYEARHLRLRVPDYKNPASKPSLQDDGDMAAGAAITEAYRNSPIYDAEAAPLDPKDFLRKMRWQNMDHAADGKAKLDLTRAAKLWVVREDLAKVKWAEMEELDRFNAVCAVSDKDLEKEFSAKVVAAWSLDQRKEGREALAIQRIGETTLRQLPESEQRDADILFAGCMCHKDLNAFKYAIDALEAMWPRDDRPALLANKANDAVIRLSEDPSSAAVQNALESSTCGAMKLVALSAMTFRNANDITGYQQLTENFLELRKRDLYPTEIAAGLVKPAQPFPDFQHCRFQTGGQGAAELFKFLELYIKLVQTVADSKVKSGDLNHVEANLLNQGVQLRENSD
ncbi:hypothetical protein HMN09_00204700 [Mycena chlorophos]|uniref:Uncharacterized protein n=1 Tax=Mycena chlorophos TaxID=658473 RepID=A0A8H6TP40_MYCCL|nr:hypothetical protein HMN09_00204700 [Mycena chlorophos]